MKKSFTLVFLLPFFGISAFAQDIKLLADKGSEISISNTSNPFISHQKNVDGKLMEDFSQSAKVMTMEKNAPAVPVFTESVIIPGQGEQALLIQYDAYEEYDNVEVAPSKGSLKRNVNPADVPYGFGKAYHEDAFYPGKLAEASKPYIFRDVRGVTISFYPYQYNPVTKKLRVYKNITVHVVTNAGKEGINEMRNDVRPSSVFTQMQNRMFRNAGAYIPVAENGDMLIIAPEEYLETIAPLAQWKAQKGIKTTVVPLSETGSDPASIQYFIQEFYTSNPSLTYVLLVGDHQDLPCYTYGISGGDEQLWSDSYYGQLEGDDYFPEVLVGRFSGSETEVATMVNRTLEYEKTPMEGDWMTKYVGIGSEEGEGFGDDGEIDWQHLRGIGDKLLANGYTYAYEFFDGSQGGNDDPDGPAPYFISDAINQGVGYINYTGHGAKDIFVTGWYTTDDVLQLENTGKYPFVVSVACNNGTFTSGTSICEAWVQDGTPEAPTGAIATCGSSILMAWAEPMQTQDEMAELITVSDPANVKVTLGGLFYNGQISMLETYGLSNTAIEVMQTWVLFGDPSVVYRNRESQVLAVQHAAQIDDESGSITVHCNAEGAVVSIIQDGVIVGTGVVVNGQVTVILGEYDATSPLTVTVTQQNYIPYEGNVTFGELGTADFNKNHFTVYPNPAKDFITVNFTSAENNIAVEVRDITGKLLHASSLLNTNTYTVNTSGYASGIYLLTVYDGSAKLTKKFVVR